MEPDQVHRGEVAWTGSAASTGVVGVHDFSASGSRGCGPLLTSNYQSLGASPLSFERALKNATVVIALGSTMTFTNHATLAHALAPIDLEVVTQHGSLAPDGGLQAVATAPAQARSINALVAAIDEEAVEDGVTHRAEILLANHITQFGASEVARYVVSAIPTARSASLLRLFGRASGIDSALRRFVVERGLASDSVEVRDAAVQAVETWEDLALARSLLRQHVEPVAWLSAYAERVADDLEG